MTVKSQHTLMSNLTKKVAARKVVEEAVINNKKR